MISKPPKKTYRIRAATTVDAIKLRNIHRDSVRGLAGPSYPRKTIIDWTHGRVPSQVTAAMRSGVKMWIAQCGPKAIAFAGYKDGELTALYVRPYKARKGAGSQLLRHVENHARKHGKRRLLCAASLNALPFYYAQGFKKKRPVKVTLQNGAPLRAVLLEKRL